MHITGSTTTLVLVTDGPAVSVSDLTADNVEAVLDLEVHPAQLRWVRPVAWYVARSAYEQVWSPVAFLHEGAVVGFAEWAYDPSDDTHCIGGVVIDARRQGQGLGKAAMRALISYLRAKPDCRTIALTVHEDNEPAQAIYRSLGFTETGERQEGELVMLLGPDVPVPGRP